MKRIEFVYLVILLSLLIAVFGFNVWVGGTITSPRDLALGLASPPDSPQDWTIQYWSTVKYRALFRLIVQGTWAVLFAPGDAWGFYAAFVFWSFLFFSGALVAFYFYLRALEFDRRTRFAGCLLFLVSPPVLFAYKYPVYTREDPLGYSLVTLGLIAIFKAKPLWVSSISTAAALARETTLVVPLVYFLASGESWRKRILVCVPPILATVGLRILWGNVVPDSFNSSILNFQTPVETIAFLFCVFGALWLPFLVELREKWRGRDFQNFAWKTLVTTGPIVLALVLGASLTLSRAREIRISFLLFPWAIPLALDWVRTNSRYLKTLAGNPFFWIFSFSIFASISTVTLYFHLTNPELMRYYLADFKNGYWLVVGTIHLSVTLALFLPMLRRQKKLHAI